MSIAMAKQQITTVIPTKDEAVHIERCAQSALPLGRVVVVDAESTDATVDLAKRAGADVFVRAWAGHAEQKNWALANTGIDTSWIMLLDADEFLTDAARTEIRAAIQGSSMSGYWLARRYVFLGREMRFAWWYPDNQLRLVRAGRAHFEPRSVHEHLVVHGPVKQLGAEIWHENLKGLGAFVERHNRYASLESGELMHGSPGIRKGSVFGDWAARRRALKVRVWMRLPGRPLIRFVWLYLVRQGFRDGREGLYYCALIAWYDLLINAKYFERQLGQGHAQGYDITQPHPRARRRFFLNPEQGLDQSGT